MDVKTGFFYLFSVVLLFASFRVVTARNPVHAVLFLMLAFSQASGLWLLLQAEFLAMVLVLVYLGAVMVLFLFVVMMLDLNLDTLRQGFWKPRPRPWPRTQLGAATTAPKLGRKPASETTQHELGCAQSRLGMMQTEAPPRRDKRNQF